MSKKILVIDDSPFVFHQVADIVEGSDYEVVGSAKTGELGIELYKELKPDFVILDIVMPGINGIETGKRLLEINPEAKIIILSSLCDAGTVEEVKEAGIRYLLPKPVQGDILLVTLKMLERR